VLGCDHASAHARRAHVRRHDQDVDSRAAATSDRARRRTRSPRRTARVRSEVDAPPTRCSARDSATATVVPAGFASSREVADDSDLASQVGDAFRDARDRLEGAAFATGSGNGASMALVTRLAATTSSRLASTTNSADGAVDAYALLNALPPRFVARSSWMAHWFMCSLTRQFGVPGLVTDLGSEPGESLLIGRPASTARGCKV
jgi:hypothetical protein